MNYSHSFQNNNIVKLLLLTVERTFSIHVYCLVFVVVYHPQTEDGESIYSERCLIVSHYLFTVLYVLVA